VSITPQFIQLIPDTPIHTDNASQVRAIRDDHFDLWKHKLTTFVTGTPSLIVRSLNFPNRYHALEREPAYVHPTLDDLPGAAKYLDQLSDDDGSMIYTGACHCQAIKFAVKSVPLETAEICDCACSICVGVSLSLSRNQHDPS
jgi:hypothetical protein